MSLESTSLVGLPPFNTAEKQALTGWGGLTHSHMKNYFFVFIVFVVHNKRPTKF